MAKVTIEVDALERPNDFRSDSKFELKWYGGDQLEIILKEGNGQRTTHYLTATDSTELIKFLNQTKPQ